jgi:arylsulfatase A-like enzyme
MSFSVLTAFVVASVFGSVAATAADATPSKPNILFIVADDLGWNDVGWHGGLPKTPVMDKLIKESVELDRHYVQPVCSPTRTALMSGRWTSRWGPHVLSPTNLRAFPPGTTTLAVALKQCGYTTCLSGKWHLGSEPEWGPWNYGFDHSYGSLPGAVDPWTHEYRKGRWQKTWHRDGKRIDEEGNATELVAAEAEKWIRTAKGPWFVYVPFHAVHIPVDTPPEYKKIYEGVNLGEPDAAKEESKHRYCAMVSQLDAKVGQLVAAVDQTGQRQNTIIIFTSDNGGLLSGGNAYVSKVPPTPALASNLPLRGQKNQLYEGGVRVPAWVSWPGKLQPRKLEAPLHIADWMPTLTKLAGWKKPDNVKFDGLDIWPVLTGEAAKPEPRTIYIPHPSGSIVMRDGWKLITRKPGKDAKEPKIELFNVFEDPSEKKEISKEQPQHVKELQAILTDLQKDDMTKLPADLKPEGAFEK